ncbi:hypothetical protein BDZ91DRAFT_395850 [Kalaharituber pfeilii]|nr:hypothetical protein BDZ91DRAFT_395850 [Kalaharituber pfeilii]
MIYRQTTRHTLLLTTFFPPPQILENRIIIMSTLTCTTSSLVTTLLILLILAQTILAIPVSVPEPKPATTASESFPCISSCIRAVSNTSSTCLDEDNAPTGVDTRCVCPLTTAISDNKSFVTCYQQCSDVEIAVFESTCGEINPDDEDDGDGNDDDDGTTRKPQDVGHGQNDGDDDKNGGGGSRIPTGRNAASVVRPEGIVGWTGVTVVVVGVMVVWI